MVHKTGNDRANNIEGTAEPDTLGGRGGNDHIEGYSGSDRIYGDTGNDLLEGHGGNDVIYGGPGRDWIDGDHHNDWVHGGSGNDVVRGGPGFDHVYGDSGDDTIYGDASSDSLYGGTGADRAFGGDGFNEFVFLSAREVAGGRGDRIVWFDEDVDKINIGAWDARPDLRGEQDWQYVPLVDNMRYPILGYLSSYYNSLDDITIVHFNMDYGSTAEREIVLEGWHNLNEQDFIF